jgi:hypothetical protein
MTNNDDTENAWNMSYFRPVLLRTESEEDFKKFVDELKRDEPPKTFFESIYLRDFAVHDWDKIRQSRVKADIINNAFRTALANLLRPILLPPGRNHSTYFLETYFGAKQLAWDWLYSQEGKDRVSALLEEAGLDMWAVEAEALRLSLDHIERVDRLIAAAEAGRDKALRSFAWCRESFVKKLQQSSERILAAEKVPSIVSSGLAS